MATPDFVRAPTHAGGTPSPYLSPVGRGEEVRGIIGEARKGGGTPLRVS
jgi:hypothetical protein